MWDQIHILKEQTDQKSKQLQSLKMFFKQYKKSIDSFKDGMKKAAL